MKRVEDDLLVQTVEKYSTSDGLFRDWSEVASELPGSLPHQCKECYILADTVVELTFVFQKGHLSCHIHLNRVTDFPNVHV